MQWTGEGGAGYGEEPPSGRGYGYAHGHEATGGTAVDTATAEPEPWAAGAPVLVAGPDRLAGAEWDSPHGDVITVLPTDLDESGRPVPEPDTPENDPARPVFVDASGRRQRRVRRAARLLLIPAGVYVALLVSALLGGPTISAPFVPLPDTTHPATPRATTPGSPAGTDHGHPARSTDSGAADQDALDARPTAPRTAPGRTGGQAAATTPATTSATTATPAGTAAPTTTATPTTSAAASAGATSTEAPSAKGRANAASHKPVK
ncbi:hypothetical protein [Streptomyces sp. NPDC001601]|uniref:hypothetical protein n=1 Tax=Streptomyces sp. NPDC001601 TaxID=3364592 RepID=UPI00369E00F9